MSASPKMTAAEMLAKVDEYYDKAGGGLDPDGKIPTLERYMLWLGYSKQTIYDYGMGKRKMDGKTISYLLARMRERQQQWAVERGMELEAAGQRTDFTRAYLERYYPVASRQEIKVDADVRSQAVVRLDQSIMSRIGQLGGDDGPAGETD